MLRSRRSQSLGKVRKIQRYARCTTALGPDSSVCPRRIADLCHPFSERYIQLLKENREKGYRGRQQNYIPGIDGPSGGPEVSTDYPTAQQAKGSAGSDNRPGNTTGKGGDVLY